MTHPTYLLLLAVVVIIAFPYDIQAASSCYGYYKFHACSGYETFCCRWTIGGYSSCCNWNEYSSTSSKSFSSRYSNNYKSCYNGYSYRRCVYGSESLCCYRTAGESSSCCGSWDYSYTSSFYRERRGESVSVGVIVGSSIGGVVFLILVIVIPVVACGACAANHRHHRTGAVTTITSTGYNNTGANIHQAPGQPVQLVQNPPLQYTQQPLPGQAHPSAPTAMYPPPAVDPAYPQKA